MNCCERMDTLDRLLPQILPQVSGCPASMAKDALRFIASDFCKISGVWEAVLTEFITAGETRAELSEIPDTARLAQVKSVRLDGKSLPESAYGVGAREIILREVPTEDVEIEARITLRPARFAETIPAEVMEEWGDIIAFGALARLKAMSGEAVPWSDPQGAQTFLTLYNEGVYAARSRAFRGRRGGGLLFMNAYDY